MSDFLYEVDGHLARLTMNRPGHLNCFSEEMIHLWTAALEDIRDRDDIYAVPPVRQRQGLLRRRRREGHGRRGRLL